MHWQWRNQKAEKKSNEEGQEERKSYSGSCYGGGTKSKLKGFKKKKKIERSRAQIRTHELGSAWLTHPPHILLFIFFNG